MPKVGKYMVHVNNRKDGKRGWTLEKEREDGRDTPVEDGAGLWGVWKNGGFYPECDGNPAEVLCRDLVMN